VAPRAPGAVFAALTGGGAWQKMVPGTTRRKSSKIPSSFFTFYLLIFILHIVFRAKWKYSITMDQAIHAELDKLKELIINAIPVEEIYLFGSYAYGTPHKDSDLDLYVVIKDDVPMRELDAGLQIRMAIARKKSMPVDIIAKKKSNFINRLDDITLERKVNRDGIRIYG